MIFTAMLDRKSEDQSIQVIVDLDYLRLYSRIDDCIRRRASFSLAALAPRGVVSMAQQQHHRSKLSPRNISSGVM